MDGKVEPEKSCDGRSRDLLAFFADRLKVHLREKGARHDLIDAVFSLGGGQDDLALIVKRVEALGELLKTDDGTNLLIGVRRAINILRDEEKKDKKSYAGAADPGLLREPQEKALFEAIQKVKKDTAAAIAVENFAGAMRALAELRAPVDAFFDKVTVNVPRPRRRPARQPPGPPLRDPRSHPHRRRLLQDRGLKPAGRRRNRGRGGRHPPIDGRGPCRGRDTRYVGRMPAPARPTPAHGMPSLK